jgi:site-specific DNA-adenine methylase
MWFAGLATDAQKVNYVKAAARGCVRLAPYIRDVEFRCCSYDEWKPDGAFIYCDPPYAGVGQEYFGLAKKASFDSDKFWETMRKWSENNVVVISEYKAPDDFKIVAEYRVYCHLNRSSKNGYAASNPKKNRSEKVFSLNKKYDPFEGIF